MAESRVLINSDEVIQGTCLQMCPQREIALRETQRRLHFFETVSFTSEPNAATNGGAENRPKSKPKADPRAIVKEFSRSAAGKAVEPSELRPAHVLIRTINYLIQEIAPKDDYPWHAIYAFIFDRSRAVRQDLVIQRISGKAFVEIYEKVCRFHILASYKLCESSADVFDPKINNDHTSECLKRLLCVYDAEYPAFIEARAEFESYYMLHNLGSVEALTRGATIPREIQNNSLFQLALQISKAATFRNFVRFFRLVKRLPCLAFCAIYKHFNRVRTNSLAAINTAYSSRNVCLPLSFLVEVLSFNNEQEASDFCSHFGLEVTSTAVKLEKNAFKPGQPPRTRFSCSVDVSVTDHISDLLLGNCLITSRGDKKTVTRLPPQNREQEAAVTRDTTCDRSKFQKKETWVGKGRGRGRRKDVQ